MTKGQKPSDAAYYEWRRAHRIATEDYPRERKRHRLGKELELEKARKQERRQPKQQADQSNSNMPYQRSPPPGRPWDGARTPRVPLVWMVCPVIRHISQPTSRLQNPLLPRLDSGYRIFIH